VSWCLRGGTRSTCSGSLVPAYNGHGVERLYQARCGEAVGSPTGWQRSGEKGAIVGKTAVPVAALDIWLCSAVKPPLSSQLTSRIVNRGLSVPRLR
jgi:hypothetical protein